MKTIVPDIALSVRQPWAWAIIHAGKDIENRSWQAVNHGFKKRGRIAIHAAKGIKRADYEDAAAFMKSIGVECPPASELLRSGIIGHVEVIDVAKESDSPWFFGPRGLVLKDPVPCEFKLCSGQLGYFRWQDRPETEPAQPAKWMLGEKLEPLEEKNLFSA